MLKYAQTFALDNNRALTGREHACPPDNTAAKPSIFVAGEINNKQFISAQTQETLSSFKFVNVRKCRQEVNVKFVLSCIFRELTIKTLYNYICAIDMLGF